MNIKRCFLNQCDYQYWANDRLFNALNRLDEDARNAPQKLYYGNIHDTIDHLLFFYRKWHVRLKGEALASSYTEQEDLNWNDLKNSIRQEIRDFQRWLECQPESYFDSKLNYRRTLKHEEKSVWVPDALTHMFTYASLERGHLSAAACVLGAPNPDMTYYSYRLEMDDHLKNMRKGKK